MKNKVKKYAAQLMGLAMGLGVVAASAGIALADGDTSPVQVNTAFGGFVASIGSILTTNLPVVLAIAAGLIGLGILLYYVRRLVGRK